MLEIHKEIPTTISDNNNTGLYSEMSTGMEIWELNYISNS